MVRHDQRPTHERASAVSTGYSALSPFKHRVFAVLWTATVVSNIGGWMYGAAASWLMTILNDDPFMVAMVQGVTSLPMFLFALPGGALADIIDKRRFILALEIAITVVSAFFAFLVSANAVTASILLLFIFLTTSFSALESPALQAIVPKLVPKQDLAAAVAINSVGINISRAIGPALAGVIILELGIAAPFWLDAFSNLGVILTIWWWQTGREPMPTLPTERFTSGIRTGFRYARNNAHLRATLARSVGFFLFASAYWALLPLVARDQISGGSETYGILLGAIGIGAVGWAFSLPMLKHKINANWIVVGSEIGTAASLVLFALASGPILAVVASLLAGISWIAALANFNVSAQVALPDWVRGRGLAMYVTVFFGTVTIGSALWGEVAALTNLRVALFVAAVGALLAIPLTWRWKLQADAGIDLSPSMHWPAPIVAGPIEPDAGPVLVTVQYRVAASNRDAFLLALEKLERERKRDGAYAWGVYEDIADPKKFVETFYVESWLEHLRQHKRVTNADRVLQEHIHRYVAEAPTVTHFVAAEPGVAGGRSVHLAAAELSKEKSK
jgi:MFS family permease